MTKVRRAVGAHGETLASAYLTARGMVVLDRNWRCPEGEVDLILRDGTAVVFCEVKTRRGAAFGTPAEAVDRRKVRKLRQLAHRWLDRTAIRPREVRFDVVEVVREPDGPFTVSHIRAAF